MPPEQINEVFDTMFAALRKTSDPAMSGVPAHARPAPDRTTADAPKAPTNEEMKAMLDPNSDTYNPTLAFDRFVQANYGGIIQDIGRNANAGLKAELRATLPDFKDYEREIDEVVSGLPPNQVNQTTYAQAYFAVKGFKQTQKEIQERQKAPTTVPPSKPKVENNEPALSAEDLSVAQVMYRGAADPVAEYRKAIKMMENQHIRVPGDAPKK